MVKEAKIDPTSVIEPVAPDMLKTSVIPTKLVWYNVNLTHLRIFRS